jgi:putative ABC transport system ATP-binding protein
MEAEVSTTGRRGPGHRNPSVGGMNTTTETPENTTADASPAARARDLVKVYGQGEAAVTALAGISLDVPTGSFSAIMGPSGSGKSTLMNCMAGLDVATSGRAWIGGTEISGLRERALTRLRRDKVGFVFQAYNLLSALSARDNITLPSDIAGHPVDPSWLATLVEVTGLCGRLAHRPAELSGGQQQRVAIARALASRPAVVFADEPTGNLDSRASAAVLALLRRCVREFGQTVVMVTHDPVSASYSDRVVFLADGRLIGTLDDPEPESVIDAMKSLGE